MNSAIAVMLALLHIIVIILVTWVGGGVGGWVGVVTMIIKHVSSTIAA